MKLNQEIVRELFDYDAKEGVLIWKSLKSKRIKVGSIAGCINAKGYVQVAVLGKRYLAHRVIWLWHYGYVPENVIDHINRDKKDNRLDNLRETSSQCNMRNSKLCKRNTSGVKGVYWNSRDSKWISQITIEGAQKHLGICEDFIEAVAHRLAGEQAINWSGCDSTSPAYLYMKNYVK